MIYHTYSKSGPPDVALLHPDNLTAHPINHGDGLNGTAGDGCPTWIFRKVPAHYPTPGTNTDTPELPVRAISRTPLLICVSIYTSMYPVYIYIYIHIIALQTISNDLNNPPPAHKGLISHTEQEVIRIIKSYIYALTKSNQNIWHITQ